MAVNDSVLINPYSADIKFKNFPNLDNDIRHHYDLLFDTIIENTGEINLTPRAYYESKIGFRDIFYYIDFLYTSNPENTIDVGCGECIWKKWFPDIVGFDVHRKNDNCDFIDYFDEDFRGYHIEEWTNGMALNSIHFIDWSEIVKQIDSAMDIVQKSFLFTFNFNMMSNVPDMPMENQIVEFKKILLDTGYKILLFDAPILRGLDEEKFVPFSNINGTVRFILSKN